MSSTHTNPVVVIVVNSVLSVLILGVAVYANRCLLSRSDKRRWKVLRDLQRLAGTDDLQTPFLSESCGVQQTRVNALHTPLFRQRYYESSGTSSVGASSVDEHGLLREDDGLLSAGGGDSISSFVREREEADRPYRQRGRASLIHRPDRQEDFRFVEGTHADVGRSNVTAALYGCNNATTNDGSGMLAAVESPIFRPAAVGPGRQLPSTVAYLCDGIPPEGPWTVETGNAAQAALRGPAKPNDEGCNWSVLSDKQSVLFMLAMVSCSCQSVTLLSMSLLDLTHLEVHGDRIFQDMMSLPQAYSIFLYFTVLCIFLFKLVDAEDQIPAWKFRATLWGIIVLKTLLLSVAIYLTLSATQPTAMELYGSVLQGVLAIAFIVSGWLLPRRILALGDILSPVASKVRRVCFVTAACLILRLTVLLPAVQSLFAIAGVFAITIFYFFGMLPIALSLHLLRSR